MAANWPFARCAACGNCAAYFSLNLVFLKTEIDVIKKMSTVKIRCRLGDSARVINGELCVGSFKFMMADEINDYLIMTFCFGDQKNYITLNLKTGQLREFCVNVPAVGHYLVMMPEVTAVQMLQSSNSHNIEITTINLVKVVNVHCEDCSRGSFCGQFYLSASTGYFVWNYPNRFIIKENGSFTIRRLDYGKPLFCAHRQFIFFIVNSELIEL